MIYFTESLKSYELPTGDQSSPWLWRRLTDAELHAAKILASGVTPETAPELRRDMVQWAQFAYGVSGSRDIFLSIPHTGYCLFVNISPVLNLAP